MHISLSDNIRAFRKERKMTQEKLAEALGVTAGAVCKWESGLSLPELDMIMEMADLFDTPGDCPHAVNPEIRAF
ncbi:MAG: helix-turn-helix transcriptional regulator [Clostridia bacterium]|nr:helix-turn-helix transcriptional regulator [Clostridia bacterium]